MIGHVPPPGQHKQLSIVTSSSFPQWISEISSYRTPAYGMRTIVLSPQVRTYVPRQHEDVGADDNKYVTRTLIVECRSVDFWEDVQDRGPEQVGSCFFFSFSFFFFKMIKNRSSRYIKPSMRGPRGGQLEDITP